jgi:hypothetical protein
MPAAVLGEFEQLVLLAVLRLGRAAYGAAATYPLPPFTRRSTASNKKDSRNHVSGRPRRNAGARENVITQSHPQASAS